MKNNIRHIILLAGLACISALAAETYEIVVTRGPGTEGTLTCLAANVKDVKCHWEKGKRIPAGTYPKCSTTIMATKNHKSVFIPDVPGFTGIFIHPGSGPQDSDGCIVADKVHVEKIYSKIPRDQKNITVKVVGR